MIHRPPLSSQPGRRDFQLLTNIPIDALGGVRRVRGHGLPRALDVFGVDQRRHESQMGLGNVLVKNMHDGTVRT